MTVLDHGKAFMEAHSRDIGVDDPAAFIACDRARTAALEALIRTPATTPAELVTKLEVAIELRRADHDVMLDRLLESALQEVSGLFQKDQK